LTLQKRIGQETINRKVDFRYFVALRNVKPLELYLVDEFFIRGAKKQFSMNEETFQDFQIHITDENVSKADYENEYSQQERATILENVKKSIKDVFIAFEARHGEEIEKLGNKDKSRALYGVDVSVDQSFNAKVLEVTNNPDFENYNDNKFPPQLIN